MYRKTCEIVQFLLTVQDILPSPTSILIFHGTREVRMWQSKSNIYRCEKKPRGKKKHLSVLKEMMEDWMEMMENEIVSITVASGTLCIHLTY